MKIVFNNGSAFLSLDIPCVPRINESIYYDEDEFLVVGVEYCIDDNGLCHVNLDLESK